MLKTVDLPPHLKFGITPLKRGIEVGREVRVFGSDTETIDLSPTERGYPDTLQFAGPDDECFLEVDESTVLPKFWGWLFPRLEGPAMNLCYLHNLKFDIRIIFCRQLKLIYELGTDIDFYFNPFTGDSWSRADFDKLQLRASPLVHTVMLYGKVNSIEMNQQGRQLTVLDSYAFTQTSLAKSCKMFDLSEQKLKKPKDLGQKRSRTKEFVDYAMQDARAVRALGMKILDFHKQFDVQPSLTLPAFAARVFRRKFLRPSESIPFPPLECVRACELSYHGGKNGYYLTAPCVKDDVYEVDISSAYPHAMSNLPPMTDGRYCRVKRFMPDCAGVYLLRGRTGSCRYPLVFDHEFKPFAPHKDFEAWTFCHECAEVFDNSDIDCEVLDGWVWRPDDHARNPLEEYVRYFYDMKSSYPKTHPLYHLAKLAMNSLYGKFLAAVPIEEDGVSAEIRKLQDMGVDVPDHLIIDERYDAVLGRYVKRQTRWRAGALYNPFWGSAVTSHCRAHLYRLEKTLSSMHSATDSVKTTINQEAIPGLGGLKVETLGRCYLLRNKLYLHTAKSFEFCGHNPKDLPFTYPDEHPRAGEPMVESDGQHLCKVARHGYKGRISNLWDRRHEVIETRQLRYTYRRPVGLREGLIQGLRPGSFHEYEEVMKI